MTVPPTSFVTKAAHRLLMAMAVALTAIAPPALATDAATGPAFITALDGYAAEIPVAETKGVVLALKVNGQDLGIGGRGPAWLVYPDDAAFAEQGDARWVWSVFFIRVQ